MQCYESNQIGVSCTQGKCYNSCTIFMTSISLLGLNDILLLFSPFVYSYSLIDTCITLYFNY